MYAIPKETMQVIGRNNVRIDLNISQVWKIVRTDECKAGEYALFQKADNDKNKFTIFGGYASYDNVCDWFEMIKYKRSKT